MLKAKGSHVHVIPMLWAHPNALGSAQPLVTEMGALQRASATSLPDQQSPAPALQKHPAVQPSTGTGTESRTLVPQGEFLVSTATQTPHPKHDEPGHNNTSHGQQCQDALQPHIPQARGSPSCSFPHTHRS